MELPESVISYVLPKWTAEQLMCLDYLNGVARKSIMGGEIKSSQSWPNKWCRESSQLWKAEPSSFPLGLESLVWFGDSRASPQQPHEFQSIQTPWMRLEMNPWWFNSSLMGMAPCSLSERGREDSHPAQGQDRTAHQLRHALLQGDWQDATTKKKETQGNRDTAPHPPARAETFADGPGPGMQKQKGCKCWLCISASCHLCKRRPHARSRGMRMGEGS